MFFAREGAREILIATFLLGMLGWLASLIWWPLVIPFGLIWLWALAFFRDPPRRIRVREGELCSPADGRVTEITELDHHEILGGPAVRIGIFLSIFDVHINRAPCAGRVRSLTYEAGEFLDARHPESGKRNESNSILLDPESPLPGPVEVRQIAGKVARRIICRVFAHQPVTAGERIGLIKFGSRTELILPKTAGTRILVSIGTRVYAGLTVLASQSPLV